MNSISRDINICMELLKLLEKSHEDHNDSRIHYNTAEIKRVRLLIHDLLIRNEW